MNWFKLRKRVAPERLTEEQKRKHRCAFTGHRPEKIEGEEGRIIVALRKEILAAIDDGFNVFITGMSRGVDLWAADIVIEIRRHDPNIKLICAVPFEGMEACWPVDWKKHYRMVLKEADYIQVISDQYDSGIYQKRNEWMVRHASRVIAVYNGLRGGTKNTIDYARAQNVPVHIVEV